MAVKDSDTFARANQVNWGSATGSPLLSAWTHQRGTSNNNITGNKGTADTNSASYNINTLGSGTLANFDIRVNYTPGATGDSGGPIARYADSNHWYYSDIGNLGQFAEIGKDIGGTFTTIASAAFSWTAGTTYTLRFKGVGTSLQLKVWVASSAEPPAWAITTTDSALSAAGNYGIGYDPVGATAMKFDTFVVGDGVLQVQSQEIFKIKSVQAIQARDTFKIKALLASSARAMFKIRSVLVAQSRVLFKVRALLLVSARETFQVRSLQATPARMRFQIRSLLKAGGRATFKIRSALATQARAIFAVRVPFVSIARSAFKIKSPQATQAHETFNVRSTLGGPAEALFLIKAKQVTPAQVTFKIKNTLISLLTSARVLFKIKAAPVATTSTVARGRDGLVVARSHDGLVVARGRDGNVEGRGR